VVVSWFTQNVWATGIVTFVLMWADWVLTIVQERERSLHYGDHYESYPVNTIEGNPLLQSSVAQRRIVDPKHLLLAAVLGAAVAGALLWVPPLVQVPFIGYVWGLFLIAVTTHLGNLIGYRASRRGLHGRLAMHLRTGYLVQMGRHIALALFLVLVALLAASPFVAGVAVAAITSAARQLLWMRRIPPIDETDSPPTT